MSKAIALAITLCMAFLGLASQSLASESLDRLPKAPKTELQEMLFHDMCIHSAPVEETARAESVDTNGEDSAAPAAVLAH